MWPRSVPSVKPLAYSYLRPGSTTVVLGIHIRISAAKSRLSRIRPLCHDDTYEHSSTYRLLRQFLLPHPPILHPYLASK